jgi:CRISPR/Cas system-associated exonuclease Cas4 (RecB family)
MGILPYESDKVIEYKSAAIGDRARKTDIMQLTAGMIATGAKKGELRYGNNKRFQFTKDTPAIKSSMKRIAWISEQMKLHLQTRKAPRGTPRPGKCAKCHYQKDCPDDNKAA